MRRPTRITIPEGEERQEDPTDLRGKTPVALKMKKEVKIICGTIDRRGWRSNSCPLTTKKEKIHFRETIQ